MKSNELRIGNLVFLYDELIVINSLHDKDDEVNDEISFDSIHGIKLTKEILIEFGFTNCESQDNFFKINNSIGVSTIDSKFRFIHGNFICQLVLREIEFVHELQNLYYCITGEELQYVL